MRSTSKLVAGVVSAALLAGSPLTAAMAQTAAPAAAPAQSQAGWTALTMLTPVTAATMSQSAVAVAQPEVPPPPPPPPSDIRTGMGPVPIPVLVVLAAWLAVLIYIATKHHGNNNEPNSPF